MPNGHFTGHPGRLEYRIPNGTMTVVLLPEDGHGPQVVEHLSGEILVTDHWVFLTNTNGIERVFNRETVRHILSVNP